MQPNKFTRCVDTALFNSTWSLVTLYVFAITAFTAPASIAENQFESVRKIVFSDPYDQLPHYPVTKRLFGPAGDNPHNALRAAAVRTLTSDQDLAEFPAGQKLFQPNGICYAGRWAIHAATRYTGLFGIGTNVPAIVRISVMLGDTERGARRTLGMGVKLFPPSSDAENHGYNLLVMDNISGSTRAHTSHAVLDNHPEYGGLPSLGVIGTALRIRRDMNAVDKALSPAGPNLRYRSVSHLAAIGVTPGAVTNSPHWVRLRVAPETPDVDAVDFREELALKNYFDGRLTYDIELAAFDTAGKTRANWTRAGILRLTEDVVSESCDQRLHFGHPRLDQPP